MRESLVWNREPQETTRPSADGHRSSVPTVKVAYIMSRFPKLTETFILFEMVAMVEQGISLELYPLLRERTEVMHPEAEPFVEKAHYTPFLSLPILRANLNYLLRKPRVYLSTLWDVVKGTWGSLRFFSGALAIFPKSAYFAMRMAATGVTHVHAHFASHPAVAAFIIRRLAGIPYSFTAHGSDIHRDRTMLPEKVAEAAFVVPISEFNEAVILEACEGHYADKMTVIHCGVDTRNFKPQVKPNREKVERLSGVNGTQERAPLAILCIGTLHEVKGQHHLLEACRLLKERGVELRCHFIGDGPDREALMEQRDRYGLSDRVRFHGQQTHAEVIRLLRMADVVAAPSVPSSDGRREGIPVALMEAMASGVPVVASRLSGIPELVEDGVSGVLTPPGDAHALADALERLWLDSPLRQRLGRAARERILEAFDLRTNAAALAQHFTAEAGS